ncbi:MAG: hypothetical protein E2O39_06760 [Planctomycetota bacterium]|nr:MAG: hypothetical protein E2O39_06760 [Planctomycetota bacterium]
MLRPLNVLLAGVLTLGTATAQDWPNWRGPHYDGSASATGLPIDFDQTKRVAWAAALPGPGAGTPIIHGEHVFVSAIDEQSGRLLALAFDRRTGEELWALDAGSGYRPGGEGSKTGVHDRSNYASPSPVTDGERVLFFYGNGDLVAFTLGGERLWARNLQRDFDDFAFQWTFSATPTIWEGRVFLPILQRDEPVHGRGPDHPRSFLLALDPATGATLYEHPRASDAKKESLESYATAIPYVGPEGRKALLVVGGDVITGHDPATGTELWRWGTWNAGHREMWWRLVPSAVVGAGRVLVCAPKRAPVYAVRLDGSGTLGEDGLAWKSAGRPNPVSSDVPTPLFFEGKFFVLSDVRESLSRVDPATGAVEWTIEMPGKHRWRASPTGADGKIWCLNHHGDVVVVDPKDGTILHEVAMGEEDDDQIRASIAVAHGRLFIRTNTTLFCVGG